MARNPCAPCSGIAARFGPERAVKWYLRGKAAERAALLPRETAPHGSIVRERIADKQGRSLAVRWESAHIGTMWVTADRATALRCGLIRAGGPPVFYLATDEVEFFREATPEQLNRVTEFKKAFLSPELKQ